MSSPSVAIGSSSPPPPPPPPPALDGAHRTLYTSFEWPASVLTHVPASASHSRAVPSSEAEASSLPEGDHLIALTSSEWPDNVAAASVPPPPRPPSASSRSLQTRTVPSVEEQAKVVASLQSTSRVGAVCLID